MQKFYINLASRPMRNRRLYRLLLTLTSVSAAVFIILSLTAFLGSEGRFGEESRQVRKIEARIKHLQRNDRQLDTKIEKAAQTWKGAVEQANSMIMKKSFSWDSFLAELEDLLPEACTIINMTPSLKGESRIEVRLKVAAPDMNSLIELVSRLNRSGLEDIRVNSEASAEHGLLVWELTYLYKQNV